jgi:hypothetical protein
MRKSQGLEDTDLGMTNFDHSIDEGLEEELRTGKKYGTHTAWNFCGYVWFQDEKFHEEVWHYNEYQETYSADSLRELMEDVNMEWGSE